MQTLSALLAAGAARDPSAPAITDDQGTLDWAGFAARVEGITAQLHAAGACPGERVALWLPNSADYLGAIFACARLGALAIHVNTRFRAMEVGSLLARSRASVLVTEWGFGPVDFPAILAGLSAEEHAALRMVIGRNLPDGVADVASVLAQQLAPSGSVPDAATPASPCLTFTTSGTTSGPKLVMHEQRSITMHAADVMRRLRLDAPGSALLAALPLCGTFGNVAAMAAVCGGAHLVCMNRFDGPVAVSLMRRHRVSHTAGTDDMLERIVKAADGQRFDTVRCFCFASFHAGAAAIAAAADALGLQPHGVYGSSEVQALFSISEGGNRLLGGGRPVSEAAELSIRDPATGAILPHGESGEICFKVPSRFATYLDNDAAFARAITPDGFFRSGDLGHLTPDGFVYEARLGDALRLGGFMVNPEEIEGFLLTLPGVERAQVVAGRKGADLVPVAFVIGQAGARLQEAALLAACRDQIARFKVPGRIIALDAFPTTDSPNGRKIQRVRLREMADALLQEAAA